MAWPNRRLSIFDWVNSRKQPYCDLAPLHEIKCYTYVNLNSKKLKTIRFIFCHYTPISQSISCTKHKEGCRILLLQLAGPDRARAAPVRGRAGLLRPRFVNANAQSWRMQFGPDTTIIILNYWTFCSIFRTRRFVLSSVCI